LDIRRQVPYNFRSIRLTINFFRMMNYCILAILWIIWCALHSSMISVRTTSYLKHRLGYSYCFYRLIFNLFAFVTLLPVVLYTLSVRGPVVFRWESYLIIVQVLLLAASIFLFVAGARHYDLLTFLGIRQLRREASSGALTASGLLDTTGIHGVIRHPWYLASIMIIWARGLDVSALITNIILTAYFIVGTILEEHKLLLEYGEAYRRYQKHVSMLVPFKYLRSRL
jgi:protein-S-isoprenylcysteine O-methyltransferase Ste14